MSIIPNQLYDLLTSQTALTRQCPLNPDIRSHIGEQIIQNKKQYVIEEGVGDKTKYIEEVSTTSDSGIAGLLSLSEVAYYESFFTFANRTSDMYKIQDMGGIFDEINQNAENADQASSMYAEYIESHEIIDDLYMEAVGEYPAPIIGEVTHTPKPRIVKFTDSNHIYMEFWKIGEEITKFDVNRSDYATIKTRARTVLRVHLDTGTVEYASDDDSDDHKKSIVEEVINYFAKDSPDNITDGGLLVGKPAFEGLELSNGDVEKINENIGVMSTLDSFHGRYANTSVHSIDEKPVDQDQLHKRLKKRGYIKSHPKLLLGGKDGNYELLDPTEVYDDYVPEDEIPSIPDLVREIEANSSYDHVEKYTIVLNADEDTIRIWKSANSPEIRQMVFHLIENELGW